MPLARHASRYSSTTEGTSFGAKAWRSRVPSIGNSKGGSSWDSVGLLGYPHRRMLRLALLALVVCVGCGAPVSTPPPAPAVCGEGVVQGAEECDDGNEDDPDACLRTCEAPARFVASDPHIHSHGCGGDLAPDELLELSRQRGIEVTTALVWGDGFNEDLGYFNGHDDPSSRP